MKKRILILIYLVCSNALWLLAQTNYLHNSGFEFGDQTNAPTTHSQVSELTEWEDDKVVLPLIGDPECYYHSPDWYSTSTGLIHLKEFLPNATTSTDVPAQEGNDFVGMGAGELIEQKFHNSLPLENGKEYTLSFYIRTFRRHVVEGNTFIDFQPNSDFTGTANIKVFLATQKIKYESILTCNIDGCGDGVSTFDDKKDLSTNIISTVGDISIPASEYPPGVWKKVSVTFTVPANNHTYDWIAIEEASQTDCSNQAYFAIDNVKLLRSCEYACYPTSGIPDPLISSSTSALACLTVTGLDNVSTAKLEIYSADGQNLLWYITVNGYNHGITNPIHWGGFAFNYDSNGNPTSLYGPVSNGPYLAKLTCWNDCGVFEFAEDFVKVIDPDDLPPYYTYPNGPKVPTPCCLYDLWIQNETLNGNLFYSVGHNITAGPSVSVPNTADVTFNAGNEIHLLPGFHAQQGSSFLAAIVPCDGFRISNPELSETNSTTASAIGEDKIPTNSKATQELQYKISPNPTDGYFTISSPELLYGVNVYNSLGNLIYSEKGCSNSFHFDLSGYSKGIYYLQMEGSDGKIKREKIILQ